MRRSLDFIELKTSFCSGSECHWFQVVKIMMLLSFILWWVYVFFGLNYCLELRRSNVIFWDDFLRVTKRIYTTKCIGALRK